MKDVFYSPFFALFYGLFNSLIVPFFGEISGSFVLTVLTAPLWITNVNMKDKVVKSYLTIFLVLIGTQIVTELFHDQNELVDKIKGVALTVVGLSSFWFMYAYFKGHISLFKWYLIGLTASSFVFQSAFRSELTATYSAEDVTFFKFVFVPAASNILIILSAFINSKRKSRQLTILCVFVGLTFIVMGARSGGLMLAGAALVCLYLEGRRVSLSAIKKRLLMLGITAYLLYVVLYVPMVLSGAINAGNSSQLLNSENPYNPIEMLKMGRTDSLIPFYAFLDNPIVGWGYMAHDPNYKYVSMLFDLGNIEGNFTNTLTAYRGLIPGHSLLFYFACSFGVVAFICMCLLLYKPLKYTFVSLNCHDRFKFMRLFMLTTYSWHWLFSPTGHFKYIPGFFAVIIIMATLAMKEQGAFPSRIKQ